MALFRVHYIGPTLGVCVAAMNEITWARVQQWEALHRCQNVRLRRFLGRPDELRSPPPGATFCICTFLPCLRIFPFPFFHFHLMGRCAPLRWVGNSKAQSSRCASALTWGARSGSRVVGQLNRLNSKTSPHSSCRLIGRQKVQCPP